VNLEKRIEALENTVNPARWVTIMVTQYDGEASEAFRARCEQERLAKLEDGSLKPQDKIIFVGRWHDADEIGNQVFGS
jgi:hypothetical protein